MWQWDDVCKASGKYFFYLKKEHGKRQILFLYYYSAFSYCWQGGNRAVPITSWQIDVQQWKQWQTIFLGPKITADSDWSHEIKRCLLLGGKIMANLDSVLKSRHITLPTKVGLVKAVVFPEVIYGCESWTIKESESWRSDAFELWYWRRLLRVPWTARRSTLISPKGNQPWILIGRTNAEAEAPIIWSLDRKNWLIWKDPDGGEDGEQEEKRVTEDEMVEWHHWLHGHEFEQAPGVGDGQGGLGAAVHGVTKSQTRLRDWATTNYPAQI